MLSPEQSHAPARTAPRRRRPRRSAAETQAGTAQPTVPQQSAARSQRPATAQPAVAEVAAPADDRSFAELGVPEVLLSALDAQGVRDPFPIQSATLPDTLTGRDVLGRGRTGSGKTLAFVLPIVTRLAAAPARRAAGRPRALVLVPTRELATQVHAVLRPLADATGLTTTTIFGGVGHGKQISALAAGIDVLVACPGRLEELIRMGHCDLGGVEITVLDEADHMADLGFLPSVKRLLDRTPPGGQRMLFSATLDNGVDVLVKRYLSRPVTHSVDPAVAPVSTMVHHVFLVAADAKADVVRALASGRERSVLFTRTKSGARRLARSLTAAGVPAVDLHGNLAQNARERNLAAFSSGDVTVLVATDIAARGVHVDDVTLVVHVDPPAEHKAYLHRSGRTARAGAAGAVVTIATPEQRADVQLLARKAAISPTVTPVRHDSAEILALTGPPADYVTPPEPATPVRANAGAGGRRSRGAAAPGRGTAAAGAATGGRRGADPAASAGRGDAGRGSGGRGSGGSRGRAGGRSAGAGSPGRGSGRSGGAVYSSNSDGTSGYTSGGAAAHSERSGGGRRRRGPHRAA
ncbi:DEAD/DEAH box helicase [Cryptosporangium sp. NPDC051539]|uniref:DEAD/DEAH box helicase n=1 Tax=Cryptosporangium sp. NPDC051539 TaxID=3363962 RepID=UPI0037B94E22